MRGRALFVLCLAIMPGTMVAAARAVSAAFFKAMEAADWKAAAGFLDLPALARERQSAVEGARRQRTMHR